MSGSGKHVRAALEELCVSVGEGGRIPGHSELMGLLGASERTVRAALRDLQLEGRLTRKKGAGTFVTDIVAKPATSSKTIVALARPDRSFFDRCVEILFRYTEESGLNLVFQPITESSTPEAVLALTQSSPFGFLVFGLKAAPLAERLRAMGHRTVLVGAPPAGQVMDVPCVFNDHKYGGYLVAKHLIDLGHTCISSWQVDALEGLTDSRRWLGYQRAVMESRQRGIDVDWRVMSEEPESWERDPSLATAFFRRPGAPTALVAWNDTEAVRLLITLTRAGISVPEQVSVVGYDDLPDGALAFPPLTTVHHGIEQQLDAAVEMLFSPDNVDRRQTVVIPNLVTRNSTSCPAVRSEPKRRWEEEPVP